MATYNPRECGVCNEFFDEEVRRPRTLPCSHHMCTECITQIIEESRKQCPFCRADFEAESAIDIMVNHGVEDFIRFSSIMAATGTSEASPSPSFEPSATGAFQDLDIHALRKEAASTSRHLLVSFQNMRSHIEGSMQKVSSLRDDIRDENSRIETELIPKIQTILAQNTEALDELDKSYEDLTLQLKEADERKEHLKLAVDEVDDSTAFEEAEAALERLRGSHAELQDWMEVWKDTSTGDAEMLQNALKAHKSSKTQISVAIQMLSQDGAKYKEDLEERNQVDQSEEESRDSGIPKGLPGRLPVSSLLSLNQQVTQLLETGLVYATQHGDGLIRSSKLTFVDNKVHLHFLKNQPAPPNAYTLDFKDVMSLVDESSRLVFLDLSDEESVLGRVYIRLAPDTPRAQNFTLHCTGELGPAYANTQLTIFSRGQKREQIHGGREMTLVKGLSWGGYYMRSWKAGTVGGMAGDNFGSRFNIYTQEYPGQTLDKAFGIVERGLDVLAEAISSHLDISCVRITDCGLVLP